MFRHRTNTGRVVYDRKKKAFRCRDLQRIAIAIFQNDTAYEVWDSRGCYRVLIGYLFWGLLRAAMINEERGYARGTIADLRDILYQYRTLDDFGEGSFGGAGATREGF